MGNTGVTYGHKPINVKSISSELNMVSGVTICHVTIVSLNKNLTQPEEFIDKFIRKPYIICLSEMKTNKNNI